MFIATPPILRLRTQRTMIARAASVTLAALAWATYFGGTKSGWIIHFVSSIIPSNQFYNPSRRAGEAMFQGFLGRAVIEGGKVPRIELTTDCCDREINSSTNARRDASLIDPWLLQFATGSVTQCIEATPTIQSNPERGTTGNHVSSWVDGVCVGEGHGLPFQVGR